MKGVQKNYYQILGVDRSANSQVIEKQFMQLCSELEMIRSMDPWFPVSDSILEITKAYNTLTNPKLREEYNNRIDFDIVILDKDIDKTELADISMEYKKHCAANYDELVTKFDYFKKELNSSLWIIKSTSLFLIFSVISSSALTYTSFLYLKSKYPAIHQYIEPLGMAFFMLVILIQYGLFRIFWQNKKARSMKE